MRKLSLIITIIMIHFLGYAQNSYTNEDFLRYTTDLSNYVNEINERVKSYDIDKGDAKVKAYFIMFVPSVDEKCIENGGITIELKGDEISAYQFHRPIVSKFLFYDKEISPAIEKPVEYLEKLCADGKLIDWESYIVALDSMTIWESFDKNFFGEKIFMINKNDIGKDSVKIYPAFYHSEDVKYAIEQRRNKRYKIVQPFNKNSEYVY